MPFRSLQQERWAFSTGQPFAKKWADMTVQSALPKRARPPGPSLSNVDRVALSLARKKKIQ